MYWSAFEMASSLSLGKREKGEEARTPVVSSQNQTDKSQDRLQSSPLLRYTLHKWEHWNPEKGMSLPSSHSIWARPENVVPSFPHNVKPFFDWPLAWSKHAVFRTQKLLRHWSCMELYSLAWSFFLCHVPSWQYRLCIWSLLPFSDARRVPCL